MNSRDSTGPRRNSFFKWVTNFDSPPFFLTLLFSVLVYLTNNLLSSEVDTPLITYKVHTEIQSESLNKKIQTSFDLHNEIHRSITSLTKRKITYTIKNLSETNLIPSLTVSFRFNDDNAQNYYPVFLFDESIKAISPSRLPEYTTQEVNEEQDVRPRNMVRIEITNFQPGACYEVSFYAAYNSKIRGDPSIYLDSNSPVRFRESTYKDWFLNHRYGFNLFLLLVVGLLIIFNFYAIYKSYKRQNAGSSTTPYL